MRVLEILQAVNWKWDINQVLSQPDDILEDVLRLRFYGTTLKNLGQ